MKLLYDLLCEKASIEDLGNLSITLKNRKIAFSVEQSRLEGRAVEFLKFNRFEILKARV